MSEKEMSDKYAGLEMWEHRLLEEEKELFDRTDKLRCFIDSINFTPLPTEDQNLLLEQLDAMLNYYSVLSTRTERMLVKKSTQESTDNALGISALTALRLRINYLKVY